MIEVANLAEKFTLFADHWRPRLVGELNGQQVKLARLKGEFIWHQHDDADELFLVVRRLQQGAQGSEPTILGANSIQPVSMTAATRIRNGCGPLPCTYASRPPKTKNGRRHCVATTVRYPLNDSRQRINDTAGAAPPPGPAG